MIDIAYHADIIPLQVNRRSGAGGYLTRHDAILSTKRSLAMVEHCADLEGNVDMEKLQRILEGQDTTLTVTGS